LGQARLQKGGPLPAIVARNTTNARQILPTSVDGDGIAVQRAPRA
jgi:hypothetical protein